MDNEQIIKEYEEFATNQYAKIRSQCQSYGELKKQIEKIGRDLRWRYGTDLCKMMERLMQKEIDSVLETLPIAKQDHTCGDVIIPNEERKKVGLAPIPGGDVAITKVSAGADASASEERRCGRMDIEKKISEFMQRQEGEQRAARKKERRQVCIKPDSYIGREIMYQTALMHEILEKLRKDKGSGKAAPANQLEKTELS